MYMMLSNLAGFTLESFTLLLFFFAVVVVAVVVMAIEYDAPEEAKKRNQDTLTRRKRKVDQHT